MITHSGYGPNGYSKCFIKRRKNNQMTFYDFLVTCPKCIKQLKKTADEIKSESKFCSYALTAMYELGLIIGDDVHNPVFADDNLLEENYFLIAKTTRKIYGIVSSGRKYTVGDKP